IIEQYDGAGPGEVHHLVERAFAAAEVDGRAIDHDEVDGFRRRELGRLNQVRAAQLAAELAHDERGEVERDIRALAADLGGGFPVVLRVVIDGRDYAAIPQCRGRAREQAGRKARAHFEHVA